MENLRYILYQYRPQTAIYMGHRFVTGGTIDGYMSGVKINFNIINFQL